ncbi:MAG: Ig-like domain-containing protein [Candidatus Geothermarchaeales archaeon]
MKRAAVLRSLKLLRPTVYALVVASLLVPLIPGARGVTTPGRTDALINPGQDARDASSAIPVVGFNMTSDTGTETLETISVEFVDIVGFDPGNDKDLRRLDMDSRKSGVGLYRDDGAVDDVLDAGDTPIVMDDVDWVGDRVDIDLSVTSSETVPISVAGLYQWFIVIRTADVVDTLDDGDMFSILMAADSIVATSGPGTASQPVEPVFSQILAVRLTKGVSMIGGEAWIGPEDVAVNTMAVHGLRVVDGGITSNYGIDDRIVDMRVRLREENGILTSADLQPLDPDGSVSGLALYVDDGTLEDEWDPSDTPVVLADITPRAFSFGGVTFTLTPQSPGLAVSDAPAGELDLFLVVRTRTIVTGDEFRLQVEAHGLTINGSLAPAGGADSGLMTPLDTGGTTQSSGLVRADSTPPQMRNEAWAEGSQYLFSRDLDLYFGNFMPTPEGASASGEARDDESGLALATFSSEAGLAGSPLDQILTGTDAWVEYDGTYIFDASSTDSESPAIVTILDAVGNSVSSSTTGKEYRYTFVSAPLLILPNPGWAAPGGTPTWVDDTGKLWFSNMIQGTVTADLTVDLVALSGAGLKNGTASAESSLAGGPRPGSIVYAPVKDDDTWTNSYDIGTASNDSSSPVTIWVEDNLSNAASATFEYGVDTEAPAITFVTPEAFDTLGGEVLVRVAVQELETDVRSVQIAVDPSGTLQDMLYDGQAYFAVITTAMFTDGNHRLIVRAEDMVGNVRARGLDVAFDNSIDNRPPVVVVSSPVDKAFVSGTITINATATDAFLTAFEYRVDNGPWASVNVPLDTTQFTDGQHTLTFRAVDAAGLTSVVEIAVLVDNTDPLMVFVDPPEGSSIGGFVTVRVFASDVNGISSVSLDIAGKQVILAHNGETGYYEYVFDSILLADGEYTIVAEAADSSGRSSSGSMSFRIANEIPLGTLVLKVLQDNALLILIVLLAALFLTGIVLLRRQRREGD